MHPSSIFNKRQIAALEVNKYLEDVNFKVDVEIHPKSNSARDFEDTQDAIEAEVNPNAYNEIESKIWILILINKIKAALIYRSFNIAKLQLYTCIKIKS